MVRSPAFRTSVFPAPPPPPPPVEKIVVFRMDDFQDEYLLAVQQAILSFFEAENLPMSAAIIPARTVQDGPVTERLRAMTAAGLVEPVPHGWEHVHFPEFSPEEQLQFVIQAIERIISYFGHTPTSFVPPYNEFDANTLVIIRGSGIDAMSASKADMYPYYSSKTRGPTDEFGVFHVPQSAIFAGHENNAIQRRPLEDLISSMESFAATYGYAVITLHPQDFTVLDENDFWTEELDPAEVQKLADMVAHFRQAGWTFTTLFGVTHMPA